MFYMYFSAEFLIQIRNASVIENAVLRSLVVTSLASSKFLTTNERKQLGIINSNFARQVSVLVTICIFKFKMSFWFI